MTWNPPSFVDFTTRMMTDPKGANRDLDQSIQLLTKQQEQTNQTLGGMANGTATVTGSSKRIATGLTTVANCVASIDNGSVGLNEFVSITPSATAGAVDIYVWKPTAAADTTPVASTTARTIRWAAWGT